MAEWMRAAAFSECGGPEKIRLKNVLKPAPGPGQVLVAVRACALNYMDLWQLWGPADEGYTFPFWGGADVAGVVAEAGPGVAGWEKGERVLVNPSLYCGVCEFCLAGEESLCETYGILGGDRPGGLAEFVAVNTAALMRIPDSLSFEEAAAVPLVYQTAWRAIVSQAQVRPGEDVLVLGASGGVATAAIQIARLGGARVFAITSTPEKVRKVQELGADLVFDRLVQDPWDEVRRITRGRGVDVVVENVGAQTWPHSLQILRKGGRLVTYGRTTGRLAETNLSILFWNQLHLIGSTMANRSEFAQVMRLVFDRRLRPVIDTIYPFEQTPEAYQRLAKGEQFGKIVIRVS